NKVKQLITGVPHLYMVETVDREKIADALDKAITEVDREGRGPLKVLVQVNTSGEENKSGVDPDGLVNLVKHVRENCPNLQFSGLMTIGSVESSKSADSEHDQPDFRKLVECRKTVCKELKIEEAELELSMGMSSDYLIAVSYIIVFSVSNNIIKIELGSTNVRVGSTIFGSR
ncbi:proline synthase, partial [Acrasis kona]